MLSVVVVLALSALVGLLVMRGARALDASRRRIEGIPVDPLRRDRAGLGDDVDELGSSLGRAGSRRPSER